MKWVVWEEHPKYEISEYGEVRNIKTKKLKYTNIHPTGYRLIQVKSKSKTYSYKIHRLVAEHFLEPPSEELTEKCQEEHYNVALVNHIDGDKLNNHYSNLEWCDFNHNIQEAYKLNLIPPLKGELNGRAVLTDDLVHSLCKDYEEGMMPKEACVKYSISRQQATKIRSGHAWIHISKLYNIKVNKRIKPQSSTTIERHSKGLSE